MRPPLDAVVCKPVLPAHASHKLSGGRFVLFAMAYGWPGVDQVDNWYALYLRIRSVEQV